MHLVPKNVPAFVSVIIPVLNCEKTIEAQLQAVAGQQYCGGFEIIVVDNGSRDSSSLIASSFASRTRIPVNILNVRQAIGCGPARNVGVAKAKGDFFAFCDADDQVQPGWLQGLSNALLDSHLAGGSDIFLYQRDGKSSWTWCAAEGKHLGVMPFARGGNFAARRSVFEALGGFDPRRLHCEDIELCWRAQLAGFTLKAVPDAIVVYRQRSTNWARLRQGFIWGVNEVGIIVTLKVCRDNIRLREQTGVFRFGPIISGKADPMLIGKRLGQIFGCLRHRVRIW